VRAVCAQGADLLAAASAKFKPGAKNQPTKDFLGSGFRAQEYFAQGPGMSTAGRLCNGFSLKRCSS